MYHLITDQEARDSFAIIDDIKNCWHGNGQWGSLQEIVHTAIEGCEAPDDDDGTIVMHDFSTIEEYCKALRSNSDLYIQTIHLAKAEHPSDFLTKFPELLI